MIKEGPECWIWQGHLDKDGYGRFQRNRKKVRAHRVAWELTLGPIPARLAVCHECDTPACCRPDHLFLGTQRDNLRDRDGKRRQARGIDNGRAKMSPQKVRNIRRLHSEGMTVQQLADRYGMTHGGIYWIVKRVNWRHVE